ncbi:MAG: glycosyltransferase [Methylovulum sp.]|uniref:glycosyltransferase family 32 protein n=1 Tax=Methylovulum sp. TaxID=1916980 RepID=UPI002632BE30|nr:glycosyltransferase [Methylovulum sp.]MDD2725286.1 glycosyltransferase [Methylovulum sp.]
MRKVIFHYHLFKNAGTSVDAILKTHFPNGWVTREFNAPHATKLAEVAQWIEQEQDAVAFSSHTADLPPPKLENIEVFPIIFIRHPIDRIASAYYFEKKQNSDNGSALLAKNTTLSGYIDAHLAHKGASQCRNFQSYRLAQWLMDTNGDMTELALQAIEKLPFIGLVEAFDESIQRLSDWLSPHFPEFRPMVAAKNAERISQTLEQKLAEIRADLGETKYAELLEANAADMAIYHAVQNKYSPKMIPKTIMQFWDSAFLPEDIAPLVDLWKHRNPDFKHQLFNDVTARAYIAQHYPASYLAAYDACAIPAMRSDFFRYAYLYKEGGIYVDAAITCITPLKNWLEQSENLIFVRRPTGRIINGFIVAKPGQPFLKAILEQCVININKKSSNNVWLVTGPGVINELVKSQPIDNQFTLLELQFFKLHCRIFNNLEHKKTLHWSLIQQENSIYTDANSPTKNADKQIAAPPATDENKISTLDIKLVLIGHPRCGSKSLAQYLTSTGLMVDHEGIGKDGICSWWLAARHKPAINAFIHGTAGMKTTLLPELICHFIRNPLEAIPSITIENEFNERNNISFKCRREVIKQNYQIDLADYDPLTAATLSYVYWNKLAEKTIPDLTVRIEKMNIDLLPLIHYYGLSPTDMIPQTNTSAIKFGILDKPATDAETLIRLTSAKARLYLEKYLTIYS